MTRLLRTLALLHLLLPLIAVSQPSLLQPAGRALLDVRQHATVLDTSGTRVLLHEQYRTATVLDIANPLQPATAVRFALPQRSITAGALEGNWAWIHTETIEGGHLHAVDLTDPDNPVSHPPFEAGLEDVSMFAHEGILYVLREADESWVYDISLDPVNPVRIATMPAAHRGTVEGDRLVLQGQDLGLIDISDPANPVLLDTYGPAEHEGISLYGDFLYVRGDSSVRTFDVSGDEIIFAHDTPAWADFGIEDLGFHRVGSRLLAGARGLWPDIGTCFVFDLSNPARPALAALPEFWPSAFVAASHDATVINMFGRNHYTHAGAWLYAVDLSDLQQPALVDSFYQTGSLDDVAASGDAAVASTFYNGHWIVQPNGANPPVEAHAAGNRESTFLEVAEDRLYTVERLQNNTRELVVYDISDAADPTVLQVIGPLSDVEDLARTDQAVYVEYSGQGLGTGVFEIAPDGTLIDLGELSGPDWYPRIQYLEGDGSRLIRRTFQPGRLTVFETFHPTNPVWLGDRDIGTGTLADVDNGRIVLETTNVLRLYDATNPADITLAATVYGDFRDAALSGELLLAARPNGMRIWTLHGLPDTPPQLAADGVHLFARAVTADGPWAWSLSSQYLQRWDISGIIGLVRVYVDLVPWEPSRYIPPMGGTVWFDASLQNASDETQTATVRLIVTGPAGESVEVMQRQVTLAAGERIEREWLGVDVPGWAPQGSYVCTARVFIAGEQVHSDGFSFLKLAEDTDGRQTEEPSRNAGDRWRLTERSGPPPSR